MRLLRRTLRSSVLLNLLVATVWRHRTEVATWARALPAYVRSAPEGRAKIKDDSRALARVSRDLDRERRATNGLRRFVRQVPLKLR